MTANVDPCHGKHYDKFWQNAASVTQAGQNMVEIMQNTANVPHGRLNISRSRSKRTTRWHGTFSTGLPTTNATSTATVESLSSLVLTNSVYCNRSLTVFLFPIFFIHVYKGQTKSKDRHTYNFA